MIPKPEDVDPKALEIIEKHAGPHDIDCERMKTYAALHPERHGVADACICPYRAEMIGGLARAITALVREREEARDAEWCSVWGETATPADVSDVLLALRAELREQDEEIERLKVQIETNDRKAQETATECVLVVERRRQAAEERAQAAEAKLRERECEDPDEHHGHRDMWTALWKRAEAAEERAQKAEAALAKKDEALREIIAVIQRTYGSDPSQRGVAKNRIERIAREARGE